MEHGENWWVGLSNDKIKDEVMEMIELYQKNHGIKATHEMMVKLGKSLGLAPYKGGTDETIAN